MEVRILFLAGDSVYFETKIQGNGNACVGPAVEHQRSLRVELEGAQWVREDPRGRQHPRLPAAVGRTRQVWVAGATRTLCMRPRRVWPRLCTA